MATLAQRLQAEIDRANATTSETDITVHDAIGSLIDGYGRENVTWHQCPTAVKDYLDNVDYTDDTNYTTSEIEDYIPETVVEANTKPIAETVTGEGHRNEVPNVDTPFSSTNMAGTIKPLDRLRWINTTVFTWVHSGTNKNVFQSKEELEAYIASAIVSDKTLFVIPPNQHDMPDQNYAAYYIYDNGGLHFYSYYPAGYNVRDLGGWACDGGTIKYGMLVRSGELNPADKHLMVDEIGIKTEVRLFETSRQGIDYSAWDIDFIVNPTDSVIASGLNTTAWGVLLKGIINSVTHNKPVCFHCGQGADRTGAMAVMLEGILGVSESDISKDYELTSFSPQVRTRTSTGFKGIINRIKSVGLEGGLSDTFRNHCISFALSLGITIDDINAFRCACIDGNPETIIVSMDGYSITNKLTSVANSNPSTSTEKFNGYEADLTPATGHVISSISVTMGGADITSQVFNGCKTVLRHAVTKTLSNCSTDSTKCSVVDGQGYVANLTANAGYTLEGGTVTITMGGIDMSAYYSNGKIAIPNVTGDIVITATAILSAPAYTNLADPSSEEWLNDKRISSNGLPVDAAGKTVCNIISCSKGDAIYIKGDSTFSLTSTNDRIAIYNSYDSTANSAIYSVYGSEWLANEDNNAYGYMRKISDGYYEIHINKLEAAVMRMNFATPTNASDIIITRNEPIE